MKRLISLILLASMLAFTGCGDGPRKAAFNTLYSLEQANLATYRAYFESVATGATRTNDLPAVSRAFNQAQASITVALDGVEFNTNALAPASLMVESADLIQLIESAKGKK